MHVGRGLAGVRARGRGGRGGGRAVVGGLARAEAEEGEGEEEGEGRRRRGRWRRPPRGWRDRRRRVVRAWDTVRRGGVVRGLRGGAAPDGGERPWRRRGEAAQRETVPVQEGDRAGADIVVVHGLAAAAAPRRRALLRRRPPPLRPPPPDARVPPFPRRPRGRDHDVSDKSSVGRNEHV